MNENSNPVASAIEVAKEAFRPELREVGKIGDEAAQVLAYPQGMTVVDVENFLATKRPNPRRRKGTATHATLASFIAHANRFRDADTALFAHGDMAVPSLTAVFDYHQALTMTDADGVVIDRGLAGALPRFGEHRSVYSFPVSTEWKAWLEKNGNKNAMSQQEFAEFLEDRIMDVLPPPDSDASAAHLLDIAKQLGGSFATPAKLLELSRGLTVHLDERVKQVTNLSTGEGEIQWHQTHNGADGQPLKVPSLFLIGIPAFKEGMLYRLCVRLRYRAGGGTVRWFYEIYQFERAFEDAFNEACQKAAEETKLPLFNGTPEK